MVRFAGSLDGMRLLSVDVVERRKRQSQISCGPRRHEGLEGMSW